MTGIWEKSCRALVTVCEEHLNSSVWSTGLGELKLMFALCRGGSSRAMSSQQSCSEEHCCFLKCVQWSYVPAAGPCPAPAPAAVLWRTENGRGEPSFPLLNSQYSVTDVTTEGDKPLRKLRHAKTHQFLPGDYFFMECVLQACAREPEGPGSLQYPLAVLMKDSTPSISA